MKDDAKKNPIEVPLRTTKEVPIIIPKKVPLVEPKAKSVKHK